VLSEVPAAADIQSMASSFGQDYSSIRFSNLAVAARGDLQGPERLLVQNGVQAYGVIWHSPQGRWR
jgi:hypothetical protein